jgi:hypothetical protein
MPEAKPNHIVMIVADSLRYDSVYKDGGVGVPYMEKFATQFTNASSPACWTLPATASIFTGQFPHQHQATTQTRMLSSESVTLAQMLKEKGYHTYQITSNVATTEIFGLDRGFDQVLKTWDLAEQKGLKISQLFVLLGKHRIRKTLFSKDAVSDKLSKDLKAASVWFRSFYKLMFDHATDIVKGHEKKGEKAFVFINLMETHFPYHIDKEFKLSSSNPIKKLSELMTLFSVVNQTFLIDENKSIPEKDKLNTVKNRQSKSWDLIRSDLDEFVRSMHEDKDNLVIFTSDHGENFGDQDWVYHFSNVTDACTRVPVFWLDHNGVDPGIRDHKTSSRLLFHSIAKKVGYTHLNGHDMFNNNIYNIPISQSYWYNHHGKTLDKYKFNQFCFHYDGMRYLKKNGSWASAITTEYNDGKKEMLFENLSKGTNPIEEFVDDAEAQKYLRSNLSDFLSFEKKIES